MGNTAEADALDAEERASAAEDERVKAADRANEYAEQLAATEQQLTTAEAQVAELQSALKEARGSSNGQLEALREESARLKHSEMEKLKELERLARELGEKTAEVLKIKQQANTAEGDALEAEERATELEEQLEAAQAELKRVKAESLTQGDGIGHAERELAMVKAEQLSSKMAAQAQNKLQTETQAALDEMSDKFKLTEAALQDARAQLEKAEAALEKAKPSDELKAARKKFNDALAKLQGAQEATEGVLTCMGCMEIFKEPMTCQPCGHTFCKSCCDANPGKCEECGDDAPVESLSMNCLLDELCGKFTYQKQVLESLSKAK